MKRTFNSPLVSGSVRALTGERVRADSRALTFAFRCLLGSEAETDSREDGVGRFRAYGCPEKMTTEGFLTLYNANLCSVFA